MLLREYFPPSTHNSKTEFDQVLDIIHQHPDFFSYIAHVKSGMYSHTSPSFTSLTGYPVTEIEKKGVNFYLEHVPKEDVPEIMKRQAEAFKEAAKPDFNPELPNFVEMRSRFQKADGSYCSNIALATAFRFLPNGEFDVVLVGVMVQSDDPLKDERAKGAMRSLMTEARKLYRLIYPQPQFVKKTEPLTEIVFELEPRHILTPKEKEVLKRIAQGQSTKEIAYDLRISENTVETHRKNMLRKLEAKNVAELVKKASKLYWLD